VYGKAAQGVQDPGFHNVDSLLKDKSSNSLVENMWQMGPFN
jgi:hypothetical protein